MGFGIGFGTGLSGFGIGLSGFGIGLSGCSRAISAMKLWLLLVREPMPESTVPSSLVASDRKGQNGPIGVMY